MLHVGLFKAFSSIFDVLKASSHEPSFPYILKQLFFYKSLLEKWHFKIEFLNGHIHNQGTQKDNLTKNGLQKTILDFY